VPVGKFTFWKILKEAPFNVIFVNDASARWYLDGIPEHPSEEALEAALRDAIHSLDPSLPVMTVGASMGAYAALRYGSKLGAARVLAMGPEVELCLPHGRSIETVKDRTAGDGDISGLKFASPRDVLIVSGNADVVDFYSACRFKAANREFNVWLLNNIPHAVAVTLDEEDGLREFVVDYLSRGDLSALHKYGRGRVHPVKDATRFMEFHKRTEARGSYPEAIETLRAMAHKSGDWALVQYFYGLALRQAGEISTAIEQFRRAVTAMPTLGRARFKLAEALMKQKSFSEAVVELEYLREQKNTLGVSLMLSRGYQGLGRRGLAIHVLEQALSLRLSKDEKTSISQQMVAVAKSIVG
jgi:hypothetical protein